MCLIRFNLWHQNLPVFVSLCHYNVSKKKKNLLIPTD